MQIEVSNGEIVDKLTILEIKKNNINNKEKLININKEYNYLYQIVFDQIKISKNDYNKLARLVYLTNDKRFEFKKLINLKTKSIFIEEKSYE